MHMYRKVFPPRSKAAVLGFVACWVLVMCLIATCIIAGVRYYAEGGGGNVDPIAFPPAQPHTTTTKKPAQAFGMEELLRYMRTFAARHNITLSDNDTSQIRMSRYSSHVVDRISQEYEDYVATLLSSGTKAASVTPEDVLMRYYNGSGAEISVFNHEAEVELLDESYALHMSRSALFSDPMHSLRRGYGLEGSTFVAIDAPLSGSRFFSNALVDGEKLTSTDSSSSALESNHCANTVHSIFESSRWPISISVGIIELVVTDAEALATRSPTVRLNTTTPLPQNIIDPVQHPCVPRSYYSHSSEEHLGFRYKDNIRIKPISFPMKLPHVNGKPQSQLPFTSTAAVRFAALQLYRGESYIVFLRAGIVLTPGWDWTARLLFLQLPAREKAVLSMRPSFIGDTVAKGLIAVAMVSGIPQEKVLVSPWTRNSKGELPIITTLELYSHIITDPYAAARFALPEYLHALLRGTPVEVATSSENPWDLLSLPGNNTNATPPRATLNPGSLSEREVINLVFDGEYDLPSTTSDPFAHLLFFSKYGCSSWFTQETQVIIKKSYERGWILLHRGEIRAAIQKQEILTSSSTILSAVTDTKKGATPQFSIKEEAVRRESSAMRDMRYMSIPDSKRGVFTSVKDLSDAATVKTSTSATETLPTSLPFFLQNLVSGDFLFARAETFFDIPPELRLRLSPAKENDIPSAVTLDPHMALLTRDESDLYLSAKLWTTGWNLFAPTEPLGFSLEDERRKEVARPEAIPEAIQKLRERTVERLANFFQADDAKKTNKSFHSGEAYGPGNARTIQAYEKFLRVPLGDVMQHG